MRVPSEKELDQAAAALATAYLNRVFQLRGTRDEWARKSLKLEANVYAQAFRGLTGVWPSTDVNKVKAMHPQYIPVADALASLISTFESGKEPTAAQMDNARIALHSIGFEWEDAPRPAPALELVS